MIRTRDLTKDFRVGKEKTVHAVRGICLDVEPGELVAVLGPNGAGKTTTMRMLTTLIAPTSGSALVAGHDVVADPAAVRREIGYVGQGNAAGHNQKVRDELYSQGLMYSLDRTAARRRAGELLEALDLEESDGRIQQPRIELLDIVGIGPHTVPGRQTFPDGRNGIFTKTKGVQTWVDIRHACGGK